MLSSGTPGHASVQQSSCALQEEGPTLSIFPSHVTLQPRVTSLQPRGPHYVIFPALSQSRCFSRFLLKPSSCWLLVFSHRAPNTVSTRIISLLWSCIFPWLLRGRGKKRVDSRIFEISLCSLWEMDEIFLNLKCIPDHWRCCETAMFLHSFSSFTSIHQCVCCTHS